jgi:hypothetical protein
MLFDIFLQFSNKASHWLLLQIHHNADMALATSIINQCSNLQSLLFSLTFTSPQALQEKLHHQDLR